MTTAASDDRVTKIKENLSDEHLPIDIADESNLRKARIALFNGWFIAMLGIVAYCFAMLDSQVKDNPYATIFEQGIVGNIAICLLIIGVVLWLRGAIMLLFDAENAMISKTDDDDL